MPDQPNERCLIERRMFHGLAIRSAAVAMGVGVMSSIAQCDDTSVAQPESKDDALGRLIAGNKRFVAGKLRHPHLGNDWRKRLSGGQSPFATILGCSDSRVPPELLFDQGFGDLFVVRVAGNVVGTDVTGSIEYGVDHLSTRLVVVMGHDGCGAVTAALGADADLANEANEIRLLVGKIRPAIAPVKEDLDFAVRLKQSVEANVRASVRQLAKIPDLRRAVDAEKTKIIGIFSNASTNTLRMPNFVCQ